MIDSTLPLLISALSCFAILCQAFAAHYFVVRNNTVLFICIIYTPHCYSLLYCSPHCHALAPHCYAIPLLFVALLHLCSSRLHLTLPLPAGALLDLATSIYAFASRYLQLFFAFAVLNNNMLFLCFTSSGLALPLLCLTYPCLTTLCFAFATHIYSAISHSRYSTICEIKRLFVILFLVIITSPKIS